MYVVIGDPRHIAGNDYLNVLCFSYTAPNLNSDYFWWISEKFWQKKIGLLKIEFDSLKIRGVFIKSIVSIWVILQFYVSRIRWELIFITYLLFKKDEESYERRKEKCSRYNWRKLSSFRKSFYVNDGLTSEDSIERGGGYPNN